MKKNNKLVQMEANDELKDDLFLRIKVTKSADEDAVAAANGTITTVSVDVDEEKTEEAKMLELAIHVQSRTKRPTLFAGKN